MLRISSLAIPVILILAVLTPWRAGAQAPSQDLMLQHQEQQQQLDRDAVRRVEQQRLQEDQQHQLRVEQTRQIEQQQAAQQQQLQQQQQQQQLQGQQNVILLQQAEQRRQQEDAQQQQAQQQSAPQAPAAQQQAAPVEQAQPQVQQQEKPRQEQGGRGTRGQFSAPLAPPGQTLPPAQPAEPRSVPHWSFSNFTPLDTIGLAALGIILFALMARMSQAKFAPERLTRFLFPSSRR